MDKNEVLTKNPLVLAFIGDALWTAHVRGVLTRVVDAKVSRLHTLASGLVNAAAQGGFLDKLYLNKQESDVAARARNAHNNSAPKNCTLMEYKKATAFEAVLGYNYLMGHTERLEEIYDALVNEESIQAKVKGEIHVS